MKKFITIAAAAGLLVIPATANAAYGTQPGFDQSLSQTSCAGAGAFGAFGANGDVRHDNGPNSPDGINGADGTLTGLNNSSLCGNR